MYKIFSTVGKELLCYNINKWVNTKTRKKLQKFVSLPLFCLIFKTLDPPKKVLGNLKSDLLGNEIFLKTTVNYFQPLKPLDRSVLQPVRNNLMNMEERTAFKSITGEWLLLMRFRLNTGWTKIVFQLCECYLKHLTRYSWTLLPHIF